MILAAPAFADRSPEGCTGSGLNISLEVNAPQVHIGDTISFGVTVLNGNGVGPIVCDASDITASLVTPDGVNHPITLVRTTLLNGQSDYYPNVVTYTALAQDVKPDGTLMATASDTGTIHQNLTNSQGGGNQGVNITIISAPAAPVPATLHVIKHVVNDNSGTKTAGNFTINVTGTNVLTPTFSGDENGTDVTLNAGTYGVDETPDVGYAKSLSPDCSGTIAAGGTKTCTITNDDIAPQLTVTKIVVGGTKVVSDFSLFIDGGSVTSGLVNMTTVGSHTVSETSDPGYTSAITGDCATDGTINLALGDVKICTITNTYIAPPSGGGGSYYTPVAPLISIVKVPSPLALPAGPGLVTYAYTLTNIGIVPMNKITVIDDSCSPLVMVSGDTSANAILQVNGKWTYTCATTLSATHTNTVVATGWANGVSATDIAIATVVVGMPIMPPLIHVTKVPSPLALPVGGGMVTYTEKVTNPGIVALSNVQLSDDRCSPVKYVSGDTNGDSKLDPTETWTYACQTNLTKTTTNTVTASGQANGLTARDFAIATVVVAPTLPNTGFGPEKKSTPWSIIILAGILILVSILFVVFRKRVIHFRS